MGDAAREQLWSYPPDYVSAETLAYRLDCSRSTIDAYVRLQLLRKSAVVFLLEAGCTDAEVSAITGQSRQMVEHYGRQLNQKKLAASAVLKWEVSGNGGTSGEQNL
jgi:biotin operon repressor